MIGKYQLQLGADQLTSGMSSSDFATDGALGIDSYGLNPFVVPGAIFSLASPTDISTNIADNLIASCADFQSTGENNRYFVGDAANFYSYNGTTITKKETGSKSYVAGKTDIIPWSGHFYASSTTYLAQWDGASSLTEAYLAFNDGIAHHPLLNYINSLYAGDGNILVTLGTGGPSWTTKLTLPPDENIVALGIDPASGLMLISTQKGYDASDVLTSQKFVYLYDGVSAEYYRKIVVDDLVTAFVNFQGQVICGIGYNIGLWNGNGVTFLRILKNTVVSNGNTDMPYKHHFSVIGRNLHVIDGPVVLTYGPVVAGKLGFFYTAYEQTSLVPTFHLTCLFNAGNVIGNRLGIAYFNSIGSTYKVFTSDFGSKGTGNGVLYFNNIYFPRPIFIRRIRIFTTGITTTSAIGGVNFNNADGTAQTTQTFVVPSLGAPSTNSPQFVFNFDYSSVELQAFQPFMAFSGQGFGIIRVVVYYDVAQ